jgi:hypothetical protein
VRDLFSALNFSERKLGRKAQGLSYKDVKTEKESATFLVSGVMTGLYDAFFVFDYINELIINEESKFIEGNIWEFSSKEEKELLIKRIKELKSFLEKIEKKAKQ